MQDESSENRREIKGEWEDSIYPSKCQAALLLMELSNPLRNFIGLIGKEHSEGCGLFPSEIKEKKKQGQVLLMVF